MHTPVAALAVAAAAPAFAQSWTWLADVSDPVVQPGDTVTVTISALMEHDTPFVALSATIYEILNQGGADAGEVQDYSILNDLCDLAQCFTWSDGASIYEISAGQLTVFGPFTSDNPIDTFEFTWVAEAPGEVQYSTNTHSAYIWAGDDKESADQIEIFDIDEAVFGWTVVPTPAAPALLAMPGATVLMRRRR